ncbi:GAF domain-containing protein [Persicobacter psychrovividus]|uniref:PAS domain-containing protein n=1 Tax=Persicobacter psychrovividus TaxID=387638 RepID=A0ABN6LEN9_9BACT|nr:hypothetical protein PEPS_39380 [Persicobacter psychrovividus]
MKKFFSHPLAVSVISIVVTFPLLLLVTLQLTLTENTPQVLLFKNIFYGILGVYYIVAAWIIFYFTKMVGKQIGAILVGLEMLFDGHWGKVKKSNKKNWSTPYRSKLHVFSNYLFKATAFVEQLGDKQVKNNDLDFELLNENDQLGKSLLALRDRLQTVAEDEEKRNWTNEGLAQFTGLLREINQGENASAFDQFLSNLVKYIGATQGAVYITDQQPEGNMMLKMVGCYAYDRKKYIDKSIEIGEGLVGQAYLEKAPIFLTDVPDHYLNIRSGLGDSAPRCVVIIPLIYGEEVQGILELASFEVLQPFHLGFLDRIGNNVAAAISSWRTSVETKDMLERLQESEHETRQQEEELRQNLEELSATQENMERLRKEKEEVLNIEREKFEKTTKLYRRILDSLPNKVFLKDADCRMVLVNDRTLEVMGGDESKILGKSDIDFFGVADGTPMVNEEKEIIKTGKRDYLQKEMDKISGGQDKYLHTTKMPLYVDTLDQVGLLGIQFDVTEQERLKRENDQLKEALTEIKE